MLSASLATYLPLLEVGDLILRLLISAVVVVGGFCVFVISTFMLFIDPITSSDTEEVKAQKKLRVKRLLTRILISLAAMLAGGISCSYQG